MTGRFMLCAALALACGGDISSGQFDMTQPRATAPKRIAATNDPQTVSKPNAEVDSRGVGGDARLPVATHAAETPSVSARATADATSASASDAGAQRDDAQTNDAQTSDAGTQTQTQTQTSDAATRAPLDVACKLDSDCASGWCRPYFAICGDPTTLPLASGLLCANDGECASGHCDPLYYDPAHQVSHNCR